MHTISHTALAGLKALATAERPTWEYHLGFSVAASCPVRNQRSRQQTWVLLRRWGPPCLCRAPSHPVGERRDGTRHTVKQVQLFGCYFNGWCPKKCHLCVSSPLWPRSFWNNQWSQHTGGSLQAWVWAESVNAPGRKRGCTLYDTNSKGTKLCKRWTIINVGYAEHKLVSTLDLHLSGSQRLGSLAC